MKQHIFIFTSISMLVLGCAVKQPAYVYDKNYIDAKLDTQTQHKIQALKRDIVHLGVRKYQAQRVAKEAVLYAHILASQYNLTWPPLVHNTMVNAGLKKKGLCFEWAEDYYIHFKKQAFDEIALYWGCANENKYNEHNALIIAKKGEPFERGIVLDPWRDSGDLYWTGVKKDSKYRWLERKDLERLLESLDMRQKDASIFIKKY